MRKVLVAFALIFGLLSPVQGAYQARDSAGNVVTLEAGVCKNTKALAELPRLNQVLRANGFPEVQPERLQPAMVVFNGRPLGACWVLIEGLVIVLDDSGKPDAVFSVPVGEFTPVQKL